MRVLITHPDFENAGGVSNYYKHLRGKFTVPVRHFIMGKRPTEKGFLRLISRMFADYWRFVKCLQKNDVNLVHVNPSFEWKCVIRDGIFALLARVNKKRVVVFFHGGLKSFKTSIENGFVWMFRFFFGKSKAFIVLSEEEKKDLERWGIRQPIYKEVTVIDEDILAGFDIQNALKKRQNSEKWSILFLSRIVREKGIYETVQAVSLLQARYPIIELLIAGDGDELENVKSFVRSRCISNVKFLGYVTGVEKRCIFEKSQVFCFPTFHGEGFPVAVVEAMAFGLPIVTRPVGGLADFFKDGVQGFISDSLDPKIFANLIEKLFVNKALYKTISLYNYQYAQSNFWASQAALRLEKIYKIALIGQKTWN